MLMFAQSKAAFLKLIFQGFTLARKDIDRKNKPNDSYIRLEQFGLQSPYHSLKSELYSWPQHCGM